MSPRTVRMPSFSSAFARAGLTRRTRLTGSSSPSVACSLSGMWEASGKIILQGEPCRASAADLRAQTVLLWRTVHWTVRVVRNCARRPAAEALTFSDKSAEAVESSPASLGLNNLKSQPTPRRTQSGRAAARRGARRLPARRSATRCAPPKRPAARPRNPRPQAASACRRLRPP